MEEVKKGKGRAAPPGRCHFCDRTDTPEWRRGPDGARTLCNACGLDYAKLQRKGQLEQRSIRPGVTKNSTVHQHEGPERISDEATHNVHRYLQSLGQEQTAHGDLSAVAIFCDHTTRLFRRVIDALSCLGPEERAATCYQSLTRSSDRLALWEDAYNVTEGGLDQIVEGSTLVRRQVMGLLVSICEVLLELKLVIAPRLSEENSRHLEYSVSALQDTLDSVNNSYSDSSSSGSFNNEDDEDTGRIDVLADLLKEHTLGLMELDQLIRNAVLDSDEEYLTQNTIKQWSPHQVFCEKVEQRFPQAAQSLVARLGKANFDRFLRCQDERQRRERQGTEEDKYRDSALGSSYGTQTLASSSGHAYAETLMSYRNEGIRSVRIPPLSEAAKEGKPFCCPACARMVTMRTNPEWKKHILADLQPWICLDAQCGIETVLFENKNDWILHLALEHGMQPSWAAVDCPLCLESTGGGKLAVIRHLTEHLEELSLSALPMVEEPDSEVSSIHNDIEAAVHKEAEDAAQAKLAAAPKEEEHRAEELKASFEIIRGAEQAVREAIEAEVQEAAVISQEESSAYDDLRTGDKVEAEQDRNAIRRAAAVAKKLAGVEEAQKQALKAQKGPETTGDASLEAKLWPEAEFEYTLEAGVTEEQIYKEKLLEEALLKAEIMARRKLEDDGKYIGETAEANCPERSPEQISGLFPASKSQPSSTPSSIAGLPSADDDVVPPPLPPPRFLPVSSFLKFHGHSTDQVLPSFQSTFGNQVIENTTDITLNNTADEVYSDYENLGTGLLKDAYHRDIDEHMRQQHSTTRSPSHAGHAELSRNMTDVFSDSLYNPDFVTGTTSSSPQTQTQFYTPSDVFAQRVSVANSQHRSAATSAIPHVTRARSPTFTIPGYGQNIPAPSDSLGPVAASVSPRASYTTSQVQDPGPDAPPGIDWFK